MTLVELLVAAIVLYALYKKRDVKAGLKFPFAAFFFEAKGHEQDSQPAKKQSNGG
jgi:hypothetical protein